MSKVSIKSEVKHNQKEKMNPSFPEFQEEIRILVVEENRIVRHALQEMFKILGLNINVDFVSDGKSALLLYSPIYHLILMDIEMSSLDGIEVTQVIRAFERNHHLPGVPIIAITSHYGTNLEYQEKCLSAGMNGWSQKPTLTQLKGIIKRYALPKISRQTSGTHSNQKSFNHEALMSESV